MSSVEVQIWNIEHVRDRIDKFHVQTITELVDTRSDLAGEVG